MQGPKVEGGDDVVSDINITLLCDIFVVLLIIFMLTADMIVQTGKEVQLPESAKPSVQPSRITITMTHEGEYQVGTESVKVNPDLANGFDELRAALKKELEKQKPEERDVMVRADKRLLIKNVMRVVQIAQADGARDVAIATKLGVTAAKAP